MAIDRELKAQLAHALCEIVNGWTQGQAAALMHLHQSELSRLRNGQLERFSVARLVRLIARHGYHIHVELRPIPRRYDPAAPKPQASVVLQGR